MSIENNFMLVISLVYGGNIGKVIVLQQIKREGEGEMGLEGCGVLRYGDYGKL